MCSCTLGSLSASRKTTTLFYPCAYSEIIFWELFILYVWRRHPAWRDTGHMKFYPGSFAGSFLTTPCHAKFPPPDLRHVGRLVGNATDFWWRFPGQTQQPQWWSPVHFSQHTSVRSHFPFLALCCGPGEEVKSSRFLLIGKEQEGIAFLKPTTNTSNVAKAIYRA